MGGPLDGFPTRSYPLGMHLVLVVPCRAHGFRQDYYLVSWGSSLKPGAIPKPIMVLLRLTHDARIGPFHSSTK